MATHDLMKLESNVPQAMPALTLDQAIERRDKFVQFVQAIMKPDVDFGVIPGTGTKAVLLKPGAEKLNTFFGLSAQYVSLEKIEDWSGAAHGGESLFYYQYRCILSKNGYPLGEGIGSCNSRESKYRYRKSERICPQCGAGTIIKGKAEWGGGWLCFAKKGGCGAKFKAGDAAIESQQVGRVVNPDVADLVNTIDKMAQKRAYIAATLNAVNASEFFTQDLEDMDRGEAVDQSAPVMSEDPATGVVLISEPQRKRLWTLAREHGWTEEEAKDLLAKHGFASSKAVAAEKYGAICGALEKGPPKPVAETREPWQPTPAWDKLAEQLTDLCVALDRPHDVGKHIELAKAMPTAAEQIAALQGSVDTLKAEHDLKRGGGEPEFALAGQEAKGKAK